MHTAPIFSSTAPLPSVRRGARGPGGRKQPSETTDTGLATNARRGSIPSLLARSAEERIGWARSQGTARGVAQVFVPAALPQRSN